jgi:uncharacterized phage protein gp47/JayE
MAIEVPTKAALLRGYERVLRSLDSDIAVNKDTDAGIRGVLLVELLYGLHYEHGKTHDDLFLSAKTTTEAIEAHAEARFGPNPRKGATKSSGTAALDLTGTAATVLAVGERLVASDGTEFQNTTGGTLDANGDLTVNIESIDTGTIANRDAGETLTFVSPPAGIEAEATLGVDCDGAVDQESDGELLARVLDAWRNPAAAGRFSDFRQWANKVEGVAAAYCYGPHSSDTDGRRGIGIVDVAIVKSGQGSDRIPSSTLQDAVDDYIEDRRPSCTKDFSVLLPTADTEDIDVTLTPKTGYESDFTVDAARTVTSWTVGTLTLTLSDTVAGFSADIAVDDRILVDGQLAKVTSLPGGNDLKLQPLSDAEANIADFVRSPTSGDTVYAGGPLSGPALVAIKALVDGLGPARGTAADPEQDWDDTLRLASLFDVLMDVTGVKDVTITTPAANVVPTDGGTPTTLNLIVHNVVVVQIA